MDGTAPLRILIVEDEALLALDLAHRLKTAGFAVVGPVGTVPDALELVARVGCDLAILDVNLGKETSEPVARELLERGVPFVTLTGYCREQLPAVFNGVPSLPKPLRMESLVAEVRQCLAAACKHAKPVVGRQGRVIRLSTH